MARPIELTCAHALCARCASQSDASGHARCPVCRHPHLLDPQRLRARAASWRQAYGSWRRGAKSGAVGEVAAIVAPAADGSADAPGGGGGGAHGERHSRRAGVLAHATATAARHGQEWQQRAELERLRKARSCHLELCELCEDA